MNILLLEDDLNIGYGIKRYLKDVHAVTVTTSVQEAKNLELFNYDLLIVDVNLPDGSGFDLVKYVRQYEETPVIFLTALDQASSVDQGFDVGGDDYMTKPFRLAELSRRIEALLKRHTTTILEVKTLRVDVHQLRCYVNEHEIMLSMQEFKLLVILMRHQGQTVDRDVLNTLLWDGEFVSDNTLSVMVKRLRDKLGCSINIETVHGKGYRLGDA